MGSRERRFDSRDRARARERASEPEGERAREREREGERVASQLIPEETRLEMLFEMHIEIFDGGAMLVN